jgi:hypothetical protein
MLVDIKTLDADMFGEILRKKSFQDNGFGCYSTFDMRPQFYQHTEGALFEKAINMILNHDYGSEFDDEDKQELASRIMVYYSECDDILVAWYWDGDGTLLVGTGGKFSINSDCKKDHYWEFI